MCGRNTSNCNAAWALIIDRSENISIDGAGLYSWFQNYNQDCVGKKNCQQRLVNIIHSANIFISQLVTIGAVEAITPAISNRYNRIVYAEDSLEATGYPWWVGVTTYLDSVARINVTQDPYPIKDGWVSFGDSYAAGIGAGKPLDNTPTCQRGRGSYMAILDHISKAAFDIKPFWQPMACTGHKARHFIDGTGKGVNQLDEWFPSTSDIATVSFTGNDLGFSNIVRHCILGVWSTSSCDSDLAKAAEILDTNSKIKELVTDVLDLIFKKNNNTRRLIVYWTGYAQFFANSDNACDNRHFFSGASRVETSPSHFVDK